jgi:hypothetical protein
MKQTDDFTKGNVMAARLLQDSPGMYPPGSLAGMWARLWIERHGEQQAAARDDGQQQAPAGDGEQLVMAFEGERAEAA